MASEALESPILCAKCMVELQPGTCSFYRVSIEAVSDPTPPRDMPNDSAALRKQIEKTLKAMEAISPQEAMDQVCRRLTIELCNDCYRRWIEDPTG